MKKIVTPSIPESINLAIEIHKDELRKFSGNPYIDHPIEVYRILREYKITDPVILSAGILHDTLESTKDYNETTRDILEVGGAEVLEIVQVLTNNEEDMKEAGGKLLYMGDKCSHLSEKALTVKLADRLANLLDGVYNYKVVTKKFRLKYLKETYYILGAVQSSSQLINDTQDALIETIYKACRDLRIKHKITGE